MRRFKLKKLPAFLKTFLIIGFITFIFLGVLTTAFYLLLLDRFYPQIFIAGVNLTFRPSNNAQVILEEELQKRVNTNLIFDYQNQKEENQQFVINLADSIEFMNTSQMLSVGWGYGHNKIYLPPIYLLVKPTFNENFYQQLSKISSEVDQPAISSQLKVEGEQINVTPSHDGLILDKEELIQRVSGYLNSGKLDNNHLPLEKSYPKLSYSSALEIKKRLDQIKLSPIKLNSKEQVFTLDLATVLSLIDFENAKQSLVTINTSDGSYSINSFESADSFITNTKLTLNKTKVNEYLKKIAYQIGREVQEPLFKVEQIPGVSQPKITEFRAPLEGRKLNIEKAEQRLNQALLTEGQNQVELPVETVQPKNTLTNDLGIKELLAQGVSNFKGSIENRVFNIKLAASRINGVLIAPGDEFSFNSTVGDISAATGFKQAYVIKSGRTVLDDGGGVCQVSTTIFRSALNAGLPITARTAHAYRVSYYEQGFPPGLDATIFYPTTDFKFKNDTSSHILIQAYVSGTTLYVDLYGTSDGRVATISKSTVTNVTPPPPELRQDDPTLPKGTVKQVDWSAYGATVTFKRTVVRGGQTLINETFKSNYRPWQAVFLVGTGG